MPWTAPDLSPRFHGSTFEDMVETLTAAFGPFNASPSGPTRNFDWKTNFWTDGTLSLVTGQYHADWCVRATSETPEWLSILLPRTGAIHVTLGRRTIEGSPGKLLLVNNSEAERFFLQGAPHQSEVLRLDWAIIAQTIAGIFEAPTYSTLQFLPELDLSTSSGQLIGSFVQAIIIGMRDNGPLLQSPIAISHLTHALADLVVRSVPHRLSHLLDKRIHAIAPRHVRRAIDFMHANIQRPITIHMIAEAVGASIRTLESGFRAFKGTTPSAYLRTIRLRAAREDLLDPSNRQFVGEICLKWGFFHFGRFSATYRAIYGETPSDTKNRAANT